MRRAIFCLAAAILAMAYWFIATALAIAAPLVTLGECYLRSDPVACGYESEAIKTAAFVLLGTIYAAILCWGARRFLR